MTAQEKVIQIARAEIGYLEKASNSQLDDKTANAGSNNYTKYARDLDSMGVYNGAKNGYPWCDVFVDWCFIQTFGLDIAMAMTGQPMGGYGAGCTQSAGYYKSLGRFYKNDPQPGDQIFFTDDGENSMYHTGIVEKISGGKVYTIEGNTSGASGVVENGGGVCAKSYDINYSKIGGYGRPRWELAEEDEEEMDVNKLTEDQLLQLWNRMCEVLGKQKPSDWSEEERAWAEGVGLIKGDGSGGKQYMAPNTREQLMVFLYRFKELI